MRACTNKNTHSQSQSSKYYQQTHFELLHMLSKSIQLSFVLQTCFLSPIKIEMYFYMPNTQQQNVQWQHSVWGAREVFVPANKYAHCYFLRLQDQIFGARCSQFPRGSLGGVVFFASSSVWDKWKTFWLSLQGENASREELWATLRRMQDASNEERKGEKRGKH